LSVKDAIPGLDPPNPEIVRKIFALSEKETSDPMEYVHGFLVAQVLSVHPPEILPLEKVRERVEKELREEKARLAAEKDASDLLAEAKKLNSLDQAGKKQKNWKSAGRNGFPAPIPTRSSSFPRTPGTPYSSWNHRTRFLKLPSICGKGSWYASSWERPRRPKFPTLNANPSSSASRRRSRPPCGNPGWKSSEERPRLSYSRNCNSWGESRTRTGSRRLTPSRVGWVRRFFRGWTWGDPNGPDLTGRLGNVIRNAGLWGRKPRRGS